MLLAKADRGDAQHGTTTPTALRAAIRARRAKRAARAWPTYARGGARCGSSNLEQGLTRQRGQSAHYTHTPTGPGPEVPYNTAKPSLSALNTRGGSVSLQAPHADRGRKQQEASAADGCGMSIFLTTNAYDRDSRRNMALWLFVHPPLAARLRSCCLQQGLRGGCKRKPSAASSNSRESDNCRRQNTRLGAHKQAPCRGSTAL